MGTQKVKIYQEPQEETKEEKEQSEIKAKTESKEVKEKTEAKPRKSRVRGRKWQEAASKIDKNKRYSLREALEMAIKTSYTKFNGKVEVHIKFNPKKGQVIRGLVTLPHGTGKEPRVKIFNPDLISQIQKGKIDFDILLAKPSDMPALAKVAKILGPRGLMPNPKSNTVTDDPESMLKKIKSGQIEYKADAQNNLHQIIGETSWPLEKLEENFNALYNSVKQYNPVSITICATMGPGIKLKKIS